MKTIGKALMMVLMAMMISTFPPSGSKAVGQPGYYENNYSGSEVSIGIFYNALAPYGKWMNNREFGLVWVPDVGRNFHPYLTDGYWVMTNYGNTWVSDFEWGWAPFHYGRWYYDDIYGWVWIPGYEWAPAWVVWRNGGGFYGWAPLGPHVQLSVHIQLPSLYWVFLPGKYLYHPHMHRYYKPYTPSIYNRTTIINNIHIHNNNKYYSGPAPRDYRKETGYDVKIHQVTNASRPGRSTVSNRSVSLYRPEISKNSNADKTINRSVPAANSGKSTTTNRVEPGRTATNEKTVITNSSRTGSRGTINRSSGNSVRTETISRSGTANNNKSARNPNTIKSSRQINSSPAQTQHIERNAPSRSGSISRSSSSTTKSASSSRSSTPSRSKSGSQNRSSRSSK